MTAKGRKPSIGSAPGFPELVSPKAAPELRRPQVGGRRARSPPAGAGRGAGAGSQAGRGALGAAWERGARGPAGYVCAEVGGGGLGPQRPREATAEADQGLSREPG